MFKTLKALREQHKSFEDIKEAERFLNEGSKLLKGVDKHPENCLHIYVDEYSVSSKKYAYGLVAVRNEVGNIERCISR